MSALSGKRILVTGATGFVGGALCRRLVNEGAEVTGSGRKVEAAAPLVELGVRIEQADLLDAPRMAEVVKDQEIVFHVGAWLGHKDDGMARPVNVDATVSLVRQCAGVERFVHVSSIGAYGPLPDGPVDESRPVDLEQVYAYGRTKARGEVEALRLGAELGIPVTVVRPAMVHGPGAESWTVDMLRQVQRGMPVLLGSRGLTWPVYIDNLIDGMLLQATCDAAVGEAFQYCDANIGWDRFFGYYGAMCGKKTRRFPWRIAKAVAVAAEFLPLGIPLNRARLSFYATETEFSSAKAERVLGYSATVGLDEGFARAEAWLRETGRL